MPPLDYDDEELYAPDSTEVTAPTSGATRGVGYTVSGSLYGPTGSILRQLYSAGKGEQGVIDQGIARLDAMRKERDYLPLMAMAAGFLKPTRAGSFAESAGNALDASLGPLAQMRQHQQAMDQQRMNLQLARFGIDKELAKTAFTAAQKMPMYSDPAGAAAGSPGPAGPVPGGAPSATPPDGAPSDLPVVEGVPDAYYSWVKGGESGGQNIPNTYIDPKTGQRRSSGAFGPYQMMPNTWAGLVKEFGPQYGLTMEGIRDPQQQEVAVRLLTGLNQKKLRQSLGRDPTPVELRAAHALGAEGAYKLLTAPDVRIGSSLFDPSYGQQNPYLNQPVGKIKGDWTKGWARVSQTPPAEGVTPVRAPVDEIYQLPEGWRLKLNPDGTPAIDRTGKTMTIMRPTAKGGFEFRTVPVKTPGATGKGSAKQVQDKDSKTGWSWQYPDGTKMTGAPSPSSEKDTGSALVIQDKESQTGWSYQKPDGSVVRGAPPPAGAKERQEIIEDYTPEERQAIERAQGVPPMEVDPYKGLSRKSRESAITAARTRGDRFIQDREKRLDTARKGIAALDRFQELNREVDTGGSPEGWINQAGAWTGVAPMAAEMRAISNDLSRQNRQVGEGTISNFDAQIFLKIVPSLDKPRQTNDNIITAMRAAKQMEIEKTEYLRAYLDVHKTLDGAEKAWSRYANANPIFNRKSTPENYTVNPDRKSWQDYFREAGTGGRERIRVNPDEIK